MNEPNSRDKILARLRQAPQGQELPLNLPPPRPTWSAPERYEQWKRQMEGVRTEVHLVQPATWPAKLWELCQTKGIQNLLHAPQSLRGKELVEFAQNKSEAPVLLEFQSIEQDKDRLFEAQAALTGARSAIAETGSLILWPDQEESRLLSLVPPVHFVVLEQGKIHNNFPEAVAAEGWAEGLPTNALLISGPSKTADIEFVLAYGIHGPCELVVLVLAAT